MQCPPDVGTQIMQNDAGPSFFSKNSFIHIFFALVFVLALHLKHQNHGKKLMRTRQHLSVPFEPLKERQ